MSTSLTRVKVAGDGFPQAFWLAERLYRVSAVQGVYAHGAERRFRVLTRGGRFELAFNVAAGNWQVRRQPGWLSRSWYRWLNGPRYPVAPWRRRGLGLAVSAGDVVAVVRAAARRPSGCDGVEVTRGDCYANGFALVRQ